MAQPTLDQFLVRSDSKQKLQSGSGGGRRMRQATIEDLRGVVVIEQLERLKALLECKTQSKEDMIDSLNKLRKKIPSREILQKTKLGITLNELRKHKDPEVAKLAKEIRAEWKLYFKEKLERPMIEVRSDEKTQKTRLSARQLLACPLKVEESHNIPNVIEKEVFHQHNRLLNGAYKRTIRSLTFALRHHEDVLDAVATGKMKIQTFVNNYKKT